MFEFAMVILKETMFRTWTFYMDNFNASFSKIEER
jgi:hypothetical protein